MGHQEHQCFISVFFFFPRETESLLTFPRGESGSEMWPDDKHHIGLKTFHLPCSCLMLRF